MPSIFITPAGIAGGPLSTNNLDIWANGAVTFQQANLGRINLHERVRWTDNIVLTQSGVIFPFISYTGTITGPGNSGFAPIGFNFNPTLQYDTGQILASAPAFKAAPVWSPSRATTDLASYLAGYSSSVSWNPSLPPNTGTATGGTSAGFLGAGGLLGFMSAFTCAHAGSVTGNAGVIPVVADFAALNIGAIGDAMTVQVWSRVFIQNPPTPSGSGSIATLAGIDVEALTRGTNNFSMRSIGATTELRHNGAFALGTAWPWLKIGSLAVPGTPTVTPQGVSGATTYSYTITAVTNIPGTPSTGETTASGTGTTTIGNATLSASNFNRLLWGSSPGATKYRIYRTAGPGGAGLIGTYDVFTSGMQFFDDTGFAAGAVAPTTNTTGALEVNAGLTLNRTTIANANYTALLTDCIIEITALSVARTITLPTVASAGAGKIYICKKTTGAFVLNIAGNGAETVNGINPFPTTAATYRTVSIYCTGTEWLTFSEAL